LRLVSRTRPWESPLPTGVALIFSLWALCVSSCGSAPKRVSSTDTRPARQRSNILRADYAGSAACARCHADIYARWQRSPMHNMTRLPERADIKAPFSDGVFRFKDDRVVLSQKGATRFLRIESPKFGDHLFRVTKVIGGHYREDYAGLEVQSDAPNAALVGDAHDERILPVSYFLPTRSFRYKGYSVMSPERPGLKRGGVWNRTCIFCHNTVPYLSTIFGALAGPGTPPYQGSVVDALLPPERRQEWTITDEHGLRAAIAAEMAFLRGRELNDTQAYAERPLRDVVRQAVGQTRSLFKQSHLVEVGIGCESCHGGSKEHVEDPRLRPSYAPRSPFLAARPEAQGRGQQINRICARCHQVLFSQYPHTWEGGTRRGGNPGGSNINSGEARDLLLSDCGQKLGCVACHDPHAPDDENQRRMAELDQNGNKVCLRCHEKYQEPEALRAHAHHDPKGPGGQCLNCHMPKKNMSLDTRLTRYHRIGSPTEKTRVHNDRPIECALCHADRSAESLVADMERLFGKTYDRRELAVLYGDLRDNLLMSTLRRGRPHEQVVAIAVLGREKRRDAAPLIAQQLVHPLPIVRYYAVVALEQILGTTSTLDVHQDSARIQASAQKWLEQHGLAPDAPQSPTGTSGAAPSSHGPDEE
jgi:predicted CXXCH cytochrome family protein